MSSIAYLAAVAIASQAIGSVACRASALVLAGGASIVLAVVLRVAATRGGCRANRSPSSSVVFLAMAVVWRVTAPPSTLDRPGSIEALAAELEGRGGVVRLLADVVEPPKVRKSGLRAVVEVRSLFRAGRWTAASGRLRLAVRWPQAGPWEPGTRLVFDTTLRWIENWGNPGEFDWRGWNARRGIHVSGFVWDGSDIVAYVPRAGGGWRTRARVAITRHALAAGGSGAGLVAAVVSGDRRGLDEATVRAMRASGLSHLLAISGLHMGVVAGVLLWLARGPLARLLMAKRGIDVARVGALAAGAGVVFYATVSGGGVSVSRSLIMVLAALVSLWLGRGHRPFDSLAGAALLISVARPGIAGEVGFQLSFMAATVIVLRVSRKATSVGNDPLRLRELIRISLYSWAVTLPIIAHHFYRISVPAPLANAAAAVPASMTVVAGLAGAALLVVWPTLGDAVLICAARAADIVILIARGTAELPGAGMAVPDPGVALTVLLVMLVLLVARGVTRTPRVLVVLVGLTVLGVGHAAWQRYRDDRLDATFVSVGHGDAAVVKLPGGSVLVIDGGTTGRGASVVAPLLRRFRIGRIDYLAVSHVQADHWIGAAEIAAEFPVGELWYGGGDCRKAEFSGMLERLRRQGTKIIAVAEEAERGRFLTRVGRAGWRIETLWPRDDRGSCGENDRSVVLSVGFAGKTVLFTGDIEVGAERALVAGKIKAADVLKVAHHGSRTSSSSEFVSALDPEIAVVSVGRGGRFGLPSQTVLDRLQRSGARVFRTDRDGAVTVTVDRSGITARAAKRL